jgi:hypothetical protein
VMIKWRNALTGHPFGRQQPSGCKDGKEEERNSSAGGVGFSGIVGRRIPAVGEHGLGRSRADGRARGRLIPREFGFHGAGQCQEAQQKREGAVPTGPQQDWKAWHEKILAREIIDCE